MDERKWKQAWAKLQGMRANVPDEVDENFVARYHTILEMIQDLLSEDLSLFRIADDQLEPQFLFAFEEQSFSSDLRYCDRAIMMSQLDALITYLHSLVEPPPFQKGKVGF